MILPFFVCTLVKLFPHICITSRYILQKKKKKLFCVRKSVTKLCYSLLFATASLKDTLEIKESSSSVSKSSSTGSVKEKVSIVAVHFIKMKNHYQNFIYSFLCACYIIDYLNCFPKRHTGAERVIQSCAQKVLYWICEGKSE